jgi:polyhydroxyalkanoate synthesis regulator phasin
MPAPKSSSSSTSPRSKRAPKPAAAASKPAAASAKAGAAKSARSGAKGTAGAARSGAKRPAPKAKTASTRTGPASRGADGVARIAEELVNRGSNSPDLLMLTRDWIQEVLDDAAARGRVTRKDANDLAQELARRGRAQADELMAEIEQLLARGRDQFESATKRARRTEPVDRVVRGADRARRSVGVGPSFPILGYDDLNVRQVRDRLGELKRADLRKVRAYEQKHANRKSLLAVIDKSLG